MKRVSHVALLCAALALPLAACSDDECCAADTVAVSAGADDAAGGSPGGAGASTLLTSAEGKDLIESLGGEVMIIDVRTPAEFAEGHVDGAVNADVESGQFSSFIAELPKDAPYLVYCRSGRRSAVAAQAMVDSGFTQVYDMGGLIDWEAAGFPVVQ